MEWLKSFNDNYANEVSALTPFVIGVVSWLYYSVYKESKTKNAGTVYVPPVSWSFRQKYRIDTLKRFELTEDMKNYKEIETLYTPERGANTSKLNASDSKHRSCPRTRRTYWQLHLKGDRMKTGKSSTLIGKQQLTPRPLQRGVSYTGMP